MSGAFPLNLPNTYFNIDQYVPNDQKTPDVLHRYYQEQLQIHGGKMDKFALYNNTAGLSQGYYHTNLLPLPGMAQKYTLCDTADPATLVPNQKIPTIGDRLNKKHISWVWYSGGWDNALAGNTEPTFQFHHQPFAYFANYADGTQAKKDHLKDETEFISAAKNGTLPSVSFVKPLGITNEHPGYSEVHTGESHTVELINDMLNGPNGKDAVIIINYDENGGF